MALSKKSGTTIVPGLLLVRMLAVRVESWSPWSVARWRSVQAGILMALVIVLSAQPKVTAEALQFRSLGQPTADKVDAARKINELKFFKGRLYLGHGDWFENTGPTDVIPDTKMIQTFEPVVFAD